MKCCLYLLSSKMPLAVAKTKVSVDESEARTAGTTFPCSTSQTISGIRILELHYSQTTARSCIIFAISANFSVLVFNPVD